MARHGMLGGGMFGVAAAALAGALLAGLPGPGTDRAAASSCRGLPPGPLPGLTLEQYRSWYPDGAADGRREIVLVPVAGGLDPISVDALARLLAACFQAEVRVDRGIQPPPGAWVDEAAAWDAHEVCRALRRRVRPDTLAVLGVTRDDLVVCESAPVFGLGSVVTRAAVLSTRRLDDSAHPRLSTLRLLKAAVHETAHALGLPHCGLFPCNLNPCATARDLDAAPRGLCEECLAKVRWRRRFDPAARDRRLAVAWRGLGLDLADAASTASSSRTSP
jgi:predicted Zn-dependent protease